MEAILTFIRAAAPWVIMGLLVAVFAARGASGKEQKKQKQPEDNYGVEGMCLGMCLGAAIGTALDNNTGLGISLGMLVGLALGLCTHKRPEKAGK